FDGAVADYSAALQHDPRFLLAYYNRGEILYERGDYEGAIADFSAMINIDPSLPAAYNHRGLAYAAKGQHERAAADYTEALRRTPAYAAAYRNRGASYAALGEEEKAMVDHIEAMRRAPKVAAGFEGFAKLWTGAGGASKQMALEAALRACELSGWEESSCLSTLAHAYADLDAFNEAVQWADQALAFASEKEKAGRQVELEHFRSRATSATNSGRA